METKFKIGMDVVCIESLKCGDYKEGDLKTIKGIHACPLCNSIGLWFGDIDNGCYTHADCGICRGVYKLKNNWTSYSAKKWRPLDELVNIEEIENIIYQPK